MKRQRTLFESFNCEEEGANKHSNRDLKDCDGRETQHYTISVNQLHGPTTVAVNRCLKFPNSVNLAAYMRYQVQQTKDCVIYLHLQIIHLVSQLSDTQLLN